MKILIAPQDKWQELSNKLIVICQYNSKDNNEVVYGIDYSFKSQYPDFIEVEVLSQEDTFWHEEDKPIQLVQTQKGVNWMAMNIPHIPMLRLERNIPTYQVNDLFFTYLHFLEPEHRALFSSTEEPYKNLEITINER